MKEIYMKEALKMAKRAYSLGEVPVGAVIVKEDKVIGRGYNLKEVKKDCTNHAEIIAIKKAQKKINDWRLDDCEMYVTLEPCMMCTGALIQSRINKVYIGTVDEKGGTVISKMSLLDDKIFNHKVEYEVGILQEDCKKVLKDFFKSLRKGEIT